MAKALTVKAIDQLKPGPNRREIPDGLLAGLYLVVQPSGARSWAVRYRHAGQPRKLTLGAYPAIELSSARELARKALVAVAEGRDPAAEKKEARQAASDETRAMRDAVETVVATFIERYAKANTGESTWGETERVLNRETLGRVKQDDGTWKDTEPAQWRGRRIQDITRRDVIELLDGIVDRGAPIMANRTLAAIRRMFSWCIERGIIEASPCANIKAPSAEQSRDRVLSNDEVRLAWGAAERIGAPFGPLVKLLLLTGQRRDEVAGMRWAELDLAGKLWTAPSTRTKNRRAHTVPLSEQALAVLESMPRIAGKKGPALVFTTNGETPVSGYSRAKTRIDAAIAKMLSDPDDAVTKTLEKPDTAPPPWTFHDLRRTVATGMVDLGVAPHIVEAVLNHISGHKAGVAGIYNRAQYVDEKRQALELWGKFVEELVTRERQHG